MHVFLVSNLKPLPQFQPTFSRSGHALDSWDPFGVDKSIPQPLTSDIRQQANDCIFMVGEPETSVSVSLSFLLSWLWIWENSPQLYIPSSPYPSPASDSLPPSYLCISPV